MKTLIVLLLSMIVIGAYSQDTTNHKHHHSVDCKHNVGGVEMKFKDVSPSIQEGVSGALSIIFDMINWVVLVVLAVFSAFVNDAIEADNVAVWSTWLRKWLPRGLRTFIYGVAFSLCYIWAYRIHDRIEILGMLLTILFTMLILSVGGNKGIRLITENMFKWKFGGDAKAVDSKPVNDGK